MTPRYGRVIAWLSFVLGISVSIAGNIGHAASDGMKPGEWAGSAFWPLALMLTIEILTHVRWQRGGRWTAAKVAGLVLVALVAAVLSYRHLAGLMTYWGEDWANAHLGPLAVDGLMLVAATALLSISHEGKTDDLAPADTVRVSDIASPVATSEPIPEPAAQEAPRKQDSAPSRLHVVGAVSNDDAVNAAKQAYIQSEGRLSAQQVADMLGVSKSTAHRRYTSHWANERRIIR